MNDDDPLIRLAGEIADGAAIEWPRLEADSSNDDERELLQELRLLERVAEVHALAGRQTTGEEVATPAEPPALDAPLVTGETWGPLRIVGRIGRGTFGEVYRAFDPRLDREVALKLLRPGHTYQSSVETLPESAVVEEGRLMARVRHPGVVTVFGAERVHGRVGVWMELIDGRTLAQQVADGGPLPPRDVQRIGTGLAEALAAVHAAGIVHRDIKAQNVMREPSGRIVLMDFGTGLDLADEAGALAGTPLYLAPEVVRGEQATERSDVYSLGVLLFHLLTGNFPVAGETLGAIRRAHARGERSPVRGTGPRVPRRLAGIVERAMAPDPRARYQSARALADALRSVGPEALQRRVVVTAAIVVIVTGAALSVATLRVRNAPPTPPIAAVGIVEHQIDPDLQRRVQVRGPAVDDRWIPCHPRGTRGVALCDLTDSSVRPLRMPKVKGEFSPAMRAVLSPDAQWLAYQWMVEGENGSSVNIISADGTQDRQLYRSQATLDIQKWTPDGAAVVVREAPARPNQRVLLVFADGTVRELSRLDASVNATDLSPDGRVLLLTRFNGEQHDISAVDLGTGIELWTLAGAADDRQALWTPDGRGVAFISDRTGCDSVSFLALEGGRPAGAPIVLKDLGRNRPLAFGFSPDGSYLLSLSHARRTAFRVPFDAAGATPDTPRPLATRCQDDSMGASWDPTGERIAYLSGGDPLGRSARITIQSRDGRIEAEFAAPGSFNVTGRVRWSPRGDELAIVTMGADGADLLSLMNPRDGAHHELVRFPPAARGDWTGEVRWHPGGDVLYYRRGRRIVRHDLSSGGSSVVYEPLRGSFGGFDISPIDGALVLGDWNPQSDECLLRIIPAVGAAVGVGSLPGECFGIAWARDATSILAATFEGPGQRLWQVDRATGARTPVAISSDAFWDLSFSPDGKELLFSAGNPRPNMVVLKGFIAER